MKYYSTHHIAPIVDFKTATINGQAPDKGLYFPENIPMLNPEMIQHINSYSKEAIALEVIKPYVGDCISNEILQIIVEETVNFPIPLVPINNSIASLELFHGPTLAFKDIGARFMSRCLGYFVKDQPKKVTVLVATSGDTGGAVANGFFDVPNVEVIILYPSGKVSTVQEKQLTTLGKNIHAVEVKGSFDDCQQMVKTIFSEAEKFPNLFLTSANSINVARWLPQQFYYFYAFQQWEDKKLPPVVAVPSGNFGNICAGVLASSSGLPIQHFIAACNANDTIPSFLDGHPYEIKKAIPTISNAMDVGNPSNFVRMLEIFQQQLPKLKEKISSVSISDADTTAVLKRVYEQYGYLFDPHGAVGYLALEQYLKSRPGLKGFVIETAHPVKFFDVVEPIIGETIAIPENIKAQLLLDKKALLIENEVDALRQYLTQL